MVHSRNISHKRGTVASVWTVSVVRPPPPTAVRNVSLRTVMKANWPSNTCKAPGAFSGSVLGIEREADSSARSGLGIVTLWSKLSDATSATTKPPRMSTMFRLRRPHADSRWANLCGHTLSYKQLSK